MDLKDRVVLVAGGSGLLGTAIARALASAGADIAFTYLERQDAARETVAAVEALGRKAWSVTLDQTDADAIPRAVDAAAGHFGRLDGLVNNAGWNISIPFPDLAALDAGTWDRLFSTNLRGPYLLCRAAAPHLRDCPYGGTPMLKKLTRTGNSLALVLDKPLLDQVGIDATTPLEVSTDGHVIVISPVRKGRRTARVKALAAEAHQRYSGVFRRLAE
jgi:NAD(P)-dependent dehydrogenase (short-subunit alcohol dehydrogenase family)